MLQLRMTPALVMNLDPAFCKARNTSRGLRIGTRGDITH
jgi:hypothetical protein